jgi:hypothetical protein
MHKPVGADVQYPLQKHPVCYLKEHPYTVFLSLKKKQ